MYSEKFIARVNREKFVEEVILRGVESAHTFVLRFEGGTAESGFETGKTYQMTLAEDAPPATQQNNERHSENNQQ